MGPTPTDCVRLDRPLMPAGPRPERLFRGISTMIATTFAMSFGDAAVKYMSAEFAVWQLYVLR